MTDALFARSGRLDGPSRYAAPLDEVDISAQLAERAPRLTDHAAERNAFSRLAEEMAENPRNLLQKLVETVLDLCAADGSALCALDGGVLRWEGVAGLFPAVRGSTLPADGSPPYPGRDAAVLMRLPDRCFPALAVRPRLVEALLIPFRDHGETAGAVWIATARAHRNFDREDARSVASLARFAAAGWRLWKNLEAAAEAGRRKDAFLATLGHELRNPFGSIAAAAAILQQRGSAGEHAAEVIDVIVRQCQHASRLAEDLLDIARIGCGKLTLESRTVDVRDVVADTIEARRFQIDRRRQVLSVELGPRPLLAEVDPVRLAQVVVNLLDNAAKYTPEQGHIAVVLSSADGYVTIAVSDDGVGVPAAHRQRIFQPFEQVRDAREGPAGGLGLGLALVRSLTELHGGTVDVESAGAGRGSCFTVRLLSADPPYAVARKTVLHRDGAGVGK